MNIPKLATGGIIQKPQIEFVEYGRERVIPLIDITKYTKIYHRTKNRRIKRKMLKQCPMLYLQKQIEEKIGISKNMKNFEIEIGEINEL